jgi:hypothetical protein
MVGNAPSLTLLAALLLIEPPGFGGTGTEGSAGSGGIPPIADDPACAKAPAAAKPTIAAAKTPKYIFVSDLCAVIFMLHKHTAPHHVLHWISQ